METRFCNHPHFSNCELPSLCHLNDEHCPVQEYMANGELCGIGNSSFCWEKFCPDDSAKLCQQMTDFKVKGANEEMKRNTEGDLQHKCGFDRETRQFVKCDAKDTACGSLHCSGSKASASKVIKGAENTSPTTVAFFDYFEKSAHMFPMLTADEVLCKDHSICQKGVCSTVEWQKTVRECPNKCYDSGYCGPDRRCHCYHLNGTDYADVRSCLLHRNVIVPKSPQPSTNGPDLNWTDQVGEIVTQIVSTEVSNQVFVSSLEDEPIHSIWFVVIIVMCGVLFFVLLLAWLLFKKNNTYRVSGLPKIRKQQTKLTLKVRPSLSSIQGYVKSVRSARKKARLAANSI